jgi:septum site-determining protein MinD
MGKVITFTSGKGGVGKTTTTASIGTGLSLNDKKVVLVDTDIGLRNLDVVMGLENRILYNLVDLLTGRCRLKQALIRDRRYPNLYIIPSSCTKDNRDILSLGQMGVLLDELRGEFDYVLIDSPAGIGLGFSLACELADEIIVVTTPHVTAIHDADRVLSLLKRDPDRKIQLITNCYDRRLMRAGHQIGLSDIEKLLETRLIGVVYHDDNILISQNRGEPLYGKNTPAAACYQRIVGRMLGDNIAIPYDAPEKRRFFSFLLPAERDIKAGAV